MAKFVGTPGDDTLTGGIEDDFLYGYGGSDTLSGGDGYDRLYGGDGADTLFGGDGTDNMDGGLGADFMAGGLGNDTYVVDNAGDAVIENAGEGEDTVKSFLRDYRLTANVENLILSLNGAQDGRGNDLNNKMKGNDFANQMYGFGGDDVIFGYGGNDIINPGSGRDAIDGGTGTDILAFRTGATHGVSVDLAVSDFSNPAGAHVVYDDGNGNVDTLIVRNVENLETTNFNDELFGDAGNNKMVALGGNDYLRGRAGNDDMSGGTGNDIFRFEAAGAANGVDIVREFNTGDILQFAAADGYDPSAGFTYGKVAVGAGAQFVYDNSRQLFYDPDGAGGVAQIKIASILGDTVTAGDIQII